MDIEIIEGECRLHLKSFKNGIISIQKLSEFTDRVIVKCQRDMRAENREEFKRLLDCAVKDAYEAGYWKGKNENKQPKEIKSENNWKAEEVYPKGSLRD